MKKMTVFVAVLFTLCAVSAAVAGENVSGIWVTEGGGGLANEHLLLAQSGNDVHAISYFEINGSPYVWYGSGTFRGNTLECSVTYTKSPDPGTGPNGKIWWTLSDDGKRLSGKWSNNYGKSGTGASVKQK